jgi:ATP-dependent RNA helicase HelY
MRAKVPHPPEKMGKRGRSAAADDVEIARLRKALRTHPCHGCEDRESHARWAERYHKLSRETDALRRRIESRTNTIARQFDRVCDVLTSLDYLDPDASVTDSGRVLMRVYTELDLVVAESLRTGLWDGLSVPDLAAALSVLVSESRRADDQSSPRPPRGQVREVIGEMVRLWARLSRTEKDHRVDFLREPDLGFAWAAYRWAEGDDLDDVLTGTDLAAGDFVRWMKQLIDLTGQVADAAGGTPLRATARETVGLLKRGVVAYSALTE